MVPPCPAAAPTISASLAGISASAAGFSSVSVASPVPARMPPVMKGPRVGRRSGSLACPNARPAPKIAIAIAVARIAASAHLPQARMWSRRSIVIRRAHDRELGQAATRHHPRRAFRAVVAASLCRRGLARAGGCAAAAGQRRGRGRRTVGSARWRATHLTVAAGSREAPDIWMRLSLPDLRVALGGDDPICRPSRRPGGRCAIC